MSSSHYKQIVAAFIGLFLVASSIFVVPPRPVHAQFGDVVSVVSSVLLPSALSTALSIGSLETKEYILDPIAFAVAKTLAEALMDSLINWIQSGFEGNPSFVDDLGGFLLGVDVRVFEDFIGSDAIDLLCSPWKFQIQLALEYDFALGRRAEAQCSLNDVIENLDDFIDGDFSQGGWDGWFELTQRNNPYSDYFEVSNELDARIGAARFEELSLLDYGSGFFSRETCEIIPDDVDDEIEVCSITTPGKVIEQQLNHVLGSELRQLEIADELSEVLAVLFSQLVNSALSGTRGLLGI